jgi:hypothetical protein
MSVVEIQTALANVNWADVALKSVILTGPGVALTKGLKRYRPLAHTAIPKPRDPKDVDQSDAQAVDKEKAARAEARRERIKARRARRLGKLCSVLTMLGLGIAGLGLIPIAGVAFQVVSLYKWGPAIAGLVVVALLFTKGIGMIRDIKDGTVDHPWLWLAPLPLFAMLLWVGPIAGQQASDQAKETAKMMFGRSPFSTPASGTHHKKPKSADRRSGE